MKINKLKTVLIATALVGSVILGVTACRVPKERYTEVSEEMVQQWVQDFHTIYPYADFELTSLEKQDNKINAIISASGDTWGLQKMLLALSGFADAQIILTVENGAVTEGGKKGIARVRWDVSVTEYAPNDLIELYGVGLLRQCQGIVTPVGDLNATCKPAKPILVEKDNELFVLPSYIGVVQTSQGGTLLHTEIKVPSIESKIDSYSGQGSMKATNLTVKQSNKPLRSEFYILRGRSEFSLEKFEYHDEAENKHTVENVKYFEDGLIDDQGLYQGKFGFSSRGTTNLAKSLGVNERAADQFSFDMEGDVANLHAKSMARALSRFYGLGEVEVTEEESSLDSEKEILLHAPQINLHKINITINGHQGNMSLKTGLAPISVEELEVEPAILFMNKTYVNASMDLPAQWLDILNAENKMTVELLLSQVVGEGYLVLKDGRYTSHLVYEKGSLLINGKPVSWLKDLL